MPAPRHIFHVMSRTLFFLASPKGRGPDDPYLCIWVRMPHGMTRGPFSDHYITTDAAHMPGVHQPPCLPGTASAWRPVLHMTKHQ